MRSGIVAVWDKDREYAAKLSEYLHRQNSLGSAVVLYSEPEELKRAVDTRQVSLALVGRPVADSPWLSDTAHLTLTEERDGAESTVYKYQPAREMLRVIAGFRDMSAAEDALAWGPPALLRAVYSPLGGCLKTSLALVMGCILAEERKCLFLSLEVHSGFRTLFGRQYPMDLSDLFALVRQGGDICGKLSGVLQSFGQLQYIPPVIWPEDIREAERGELKELLHILAQRCGFEEIVLDMGADMSRPEEILAWCDRIYRPEKEDAFSMAKLAEYDDYLKVSGYGELTARTSRIPLAELAGEVSPARWNQWQRWEQMLPAVRRLLAKERDGHEQGE